MLRRRFKTKMPTITTTTLSPSCHGPLVEEIPSLLRLYKDGHVDRLPLVPSVPSPSFDIPLSPLLFARLYLPSSSSSSSSSSSDNSKLPVLLYFHGGGFCVGSPSWKCYHDFLSLLSSSANIAIASFSYRLAPDHRLPSAFHDALTALSSLPSLPSWWSSRCNLSNLFLAGDSAGATIALHVAAAKHLSYVPTLEMVKGLILIQPFIGGEVRTWSEENVRPPVGSALTLAISDTYWRMALPLGAGRDHEWCRGEVEVAVKRVMVCLAEMDILRDRGSELCRRLRKEGKEVVEVVHGGVGHAFQVLMGTRVAQRRREEMVVQICRFIHGREGRGEVNK